MEKENLNFDQDVITRSHDIPVLVDFWSPTCGPCLYLGPILEKLAKEGEGEWELIKVNTMFNQQLAVDYNIQSIPAVKLFHKGKVINEFVGALPEPVLRKWLDEFLPDERKEELNGIIEVLQNDRTLGLAKLRGFVDENPDLTLGKLVLGRELLLEDPKAAVAMVEDIKVGHLLYDNAQNLRVLAEILSFDGADSVAADAKLLAAKDALSKEDYEGAISHMVDAVEADKNAYNELPRRGSIALFQLFGRNHPLTNKFRKRFEMALY